MSSLPRARVYRPRIGPGRARVHGSALATTAGQVTLPALSIVDEIRTACARVASRARHVRINEDTIERYARTLPATGAAPASEPEDQLEERAAYWLQLNAINFGSGWFPTLCKPDGLSGFRTVEAGLKGHGPWPPPRSPASTPARSHPRSARSPSTSS